MKAKSSSTTWPTIRRMAVTSNHRRITMTTKRWRRWGVEWTNLVRLLLRLAHVRRNFNDSVCVWSLVLCADGVYRAGRFNARLVRMHPWVALVYVCQTSSGANRRGWTGTLTFEINWAWENLTVKINFAFCSVLFVALIPRGVFQLLTNWMQEAANAAVQNWLGFQSSAIRSHHAGKLSED
jgi:hypothetical protein